MNGNVGAAARVSGAANYLWPRSLGGSGSGGPATRSQGTIKVIQACAGGITFAAATPASWSWHGPVRLPRPTRDRALTVGTFHIPSAFGIGSYRLHLDAVRLARHGPGTFPEDDSGGRAPSRSLEAEQ